MSLFLPILSLLLCILVATCYVVRPILCAAVTVFPTWLWLVPGLFLAGLGWRRRRLAGSVGVLWMLFLLGFAEEPWSLLRGTLPASHEGSSRVIRIVSLNCAGGLLEAAREVKQYQPDILLLQESPSRGAVQQIAGELYGEEGGWAHGLDASIIARGSVQPCPLRRDEKIFLTHARVTLTGGKPMEVISLRLSPPTVRADLWSPDCWRQHAEVRRLHYEQIQMVMRRIEQIHPETPLIVGGDFNMPPGEAPLRLLQKRLQDSFRIAGAGWGSTITNEYPFHRIDQIWLSPHLRPLRVRAYRTQHSDHRLVVCDALQ